MVGGRLFGDGVRGAGGPATAIVISGDRRARSIARSRFWGAVDLHGCALCADLADVTRLAARYPIPDSIDR